MREHSSVTANAGGVPGSPSGHASPKRAAGPRVTADEIFAHERPSTRRFNWPEATPGNRRTAPKKVHW